MFCSNLKTSAQLAVWPLMCEVLFYYIFRANILKLGINFCKGCVNEESCLFGNSVVCHITCDVAGANLSLFYCATGINSLAYQWIEVKRRGVKKKQDTVFSLCLGNKLRS